MSDKCVRSHRGKRPALHVEDTSSRNENDLIVEVVNKRKKMNITVSESSSDDSSIADVTSSRVTKESRKRVSSDNESSSEESNDESSEASSSEESNDESSSEEISSEESSAKSSEESSEESSSEKSSEESSEKSSEESSEESSSEKSSEEISSEESSEESSSEEHSEEGSSEERSEESSSGGSSMESSSEGSNSEESSIESDDSIVSRTSRRAQHVNNADVSTSSNSDSEVISAESDHSSAGSYESYDNTDEERMVPACIQKSLSWAGMKLYEAKVYASTILSAASKKKASAISEPDRFASGSSNDQSEKCPICLTNFTNQQVGSPETCDHTFCSVCIQKWAKNANTCPVDRQVFSLILVRKQLNGEVIKKLLIANRGTWNVQENPEHREDSQDSDSDST